MSVKDTSGISETTVMTLEKISVIFLEAKSQVLLILPWLVAYNTNARKCCISVGG
jgi:hypothetical protein